MIFKTVSIALLLCLALPASADPPPVEGWTLLLGMGGYEEYENGGPENEDPYSRFSGFISGGYRKQALCGNDKFCLIHLAAELQTTLVADMDNRHRFMGLGNVGLLSLWSAMHLIGGVGYSNHDGFGPVIGLEASFFFILRLRMLAHPSDSSLSYTLSAGIDVLTLWRIIARWGEKPQAPVVPHDPTKEKPYTFDSDTSPDGRRPTTK